MTKITPHDINYSSMGLEIGYLYHVYFFFIKSTSCRKQKLASCLIPKITTLRKNLDLCKNVHCKDKALQCYF